MAKINRNRDFDFLSREEIMELAKPQDDLEKEILKDALIKLGSHTTIKKLANYLDLSERTIRRYIDGRKLITFKTGTSKRIYTRTILNILDLEE